MNEHEKQEQPISFEMIEKAVVNLYGGWDGFTEDKFEKEYPNVLNGDNLQNIIESLKARRNDNELVDK